jgi:membrane-bound serine protease (ClpP class)
MNWLGISLLVITALLLIAVDFYLPGFVLGSIGIVLMVAAVVFCYRHYGLEPALGLFFLETVLSIAAGVVSIKYGPRTGIGRKMILAEEQRNQRATTEPGEELIGREGVAHTYLRPSGTAFVAGKRMDVVAESGVIERGSAIKVVNVDGSQVIVRKI